MSHCGCPQPCPQPCPDPLDVVETVGCLESVNTECVTYSGDDIPCLAIIKGTDLNDIIDILANEICALDDLVGNINSFSCSDLATCSINDLGDVTTTSPVNGSYLGYSGGQWIDIAFPSPFVWACSYLNTCSLNDLGDIVIDSPSMGQVIMYDVESGDWYNGTIPAGTIYTSNNGITESGDNFKLGGVLIENTTITGGGFDLILGTSGSKLGQLDIWAADINMVSDDIISLNTSDESTQTQGFRYQKDFGSLSIGKTVFDDFSTYEGMYRIGDNITVAKTGILDPLGAYIGAGIMVDSAIGFVMGSAVAVSEFYGFMSGFRLTAEGLIGGIVLGQDIDIAGGGTGNQVAYVIGSNVDVAFASSIQQGVVVFNPSTVQINSSATGNAVNEKIKVDDLSTVVFNSNDYFFYTDLNNTDGWNVNTDVVRFTKDFIQISQSTGTVPAEKLGCIRYNTATDKYQGFTTATGWTNLH